ncbi:PadR family transcriptional regulator [bacterium]|nr:PadR family transcriptional regulator [bacterium]
MKKDQNSSILHTAPAKWVSQLRKGVLDFIILIYLNKRDHYGYELIKDIKLATDLSISEGTIYPLLNRLKKEELITSRWVEMDAGVPRKYYSITTAGRQAMGGMHKGWMDMNRTMSKLLELL